MKRYWINIALGNFLTAAIIGALLRYAFVAEINWINYRHFLHGHSHVAMLGWVYLALFILLIHWFLPEEKKEKKIYTYLFWATQVSVIGMLFSFPVQGYGAVSISFSTLHIVLSYLFAYHFLKDIKVERERSSLARWFVKAALGFMILSTLALWGLGPIMASGLRGSAWYYMSVQFFLHFQFNGWFLFAVIGLFFRFLQQQGVVINAIETKRFFYLLFIAVLTTYALAVTWAKPLPIVFFVNSLGVLLQLLAFYFFVRIVRQSKKQYTLRSWPGFLLPLAFYALLAKVIVQSAVVIPLIAKVAYTIWNFVIGFIHLILLMVVSSALIAFSRQARLIDQNRLTNSGLILFLCGMLLTEGLLFLQGTMFWGAKGFLPYYHELLFSASLFLPGGLALLFAGNLSVKNKAVLNKTAAPFD